ncbi:hypothetical protein OH77DRAFT_987469 [Trametes cingulata]|nr:hypothetical protein OH77DRAFT_987469 [Trametes cingulata]
MRPKLCADALSTGVQARVQAPGYRSEPRRPECSLKLVGPYQQCHAHTRRPLLCARAQFRHPEMRATCGNTLGPGRLYAASCTSLDPSQTRIHTPNGAALSLSSVHMHVANERSRPCPHPSCAQLQTRPNYRRGPADSVLRCAPRETDAFDGTEHDVRLLWVRSPTSLLPRPPLSRSAQADSSRRHARDRTPLPALPTSNEACTSDTDARHGVGHKVRHDVQALAPPLPPVLIPRSVPPAPGTSAHSPDRLAGAQVARPTLSRASSTSSAATAADAFQPRPPLSQRTTA